MHESKSGASPVMEFRTIDPLTGRRGEVVIVAIQNEKEVA